MKLVLNILFLLSVSNPVTAEQTSTQHVKLGAIVSLTGPAAEQGKNWLEGARFAVKQLSTENIQVDLIVEDDATTPARVKSAFEKLASIDRVQGVVGGTWDFLAEAASPVALKHKIPFVTPTNPVEILSDAARKNPWFFTNGLSMQATELAIKNVLSSLNIKTAAIVVPNVPFGVAHADAIERLAAKLGVQILSRTDFEYAGYQETMRTIALKLSESKPDLIFCLVDYSTLSLFWKEIRKRKFEPWLLTTQHLDEAVKFSGAPELWSKAIGIYPKIVNRNFNLEFNNEFGHDPKVYAAEGFDAVMFLSKSLNGKISLDTKPFKINGVAGAIESGHGVTQISKSEAIAMKVNISGQLEKL